MARTYAARFGGAVLFSPEETVGARMTNNRTDVILVQYMLNAIMNANKIYLAGDTRFTAPPGPKIALTGVWDEPSAAYLAKWEAQISEARAYWAHGRVDPTLYPGTVVPFRLGGKKIITINGMCSEFFGKNKFEQLELPGGVLPDDVWNELFYDSVRWAPRGG